MKVVPITFRQASAYVGLFHRHNKPPRGCKFCLAVVEGQETLGVAMCGRPVARAFDDGLTLEINRTCTNGARNANSMLYGAARAVAKAMGYARVITYTQGEEAGASIRAAGFVKVRALAPRSSWAQASGPQCKVKRDPIGNGGMPRVLWEVLFGSRN